MTSDLITVQPTAAPARRSGLTVVLVAIIAVCGLAVALAAGYAWGNRGHATSAAATVAEASVDAGFARDMSTHHTQAVTMAGYERDNTRNTALKLIAFDIETSQEFQVGQMQGWLDDWGLGRTSSKTPMVWMAGHSHLGADGLMPGMATPAQMTKLESSHGKALDILFLQLMIHHHEGGIPMAAYAAQHATQSYVRNLAQAMAVAQENEVIQMERLLRRLGGIPLPPPAN